MLYRFDWLNNRIDQSGWFSRESLLCEIAHQLFALDWSFKVQSEKEIDLSAIFYEIHA
ncbi:hypothetical protein [Candidatus Similichlamydia epinepheli]|uniref:hypothetical protein n=1 Tax=Candidatus Similichlamydia epinepheli TaxID=1903953 RepID=UPI00130061A4|nr:hypothetical protein [Candidatus Similichlamydia epinepheli]